MKTEHLISNGAYPQPSQAIDAEEEDEDRTRRIEQLIEEFSSGRTKEEISAEFYRAFPEEAHGSGIDYHIPAAQLVANYFDKDAANATLPMSLVKQADELSVQEAAVENQLAQLSGELVPALSAISAKITEISTTQRRKEIRQKMKDMLISKMNE